MTDNNGTACQSRSLSSHILPTSGTMIGVCATLIGLVKIAEAHIGPSRVDEYASLVSIPFLISALTSYMSMRYEEKSRRFSARCELIADQTFLLGLIGVTVISVFFAYEII
jgi:hypothetical protein